MEEEIKLSELEENVVKLIRKCKWIPSKRKNDYIDWFAEKTNGKEIYNNEDDGLAFALLVYELTETVTTGMFAFGTIREGTIERLAEKNIDKISRIWAEEKAKEEHQVGFFKSLVTKKLYNSRVPESKRYDYFHSVDKHQEDLKSRMWEMYRAYVDKK